MEDKPDFLLIAWHSRTGASADLAKAAAQGAGRSAKLYAVDDVTARDMQLASAYIFVGPENLGSLSGSMKEMLDRLYYPCLGRLEGRAYASITAAGSDGEGAVRQLDRIVKGWRLKRVAEPMIVNLGAQTPEAILAKKQVSELRLAKAHDLGAAMAEGVRQGIF